MANGAMPSSDDVPDIQPQAAVPEAVFRKNVRSPTKELGLSGLKHSAGLVDEEFIQTLRGDRWLRVAREMSENDDVVGAVLTAIEMVVRQVDWQVVPASNDAVDEANAETLRENMEDMSHTFSDHVAEVLSMLPYGFCYHEVVYKRRLGENRNPGQSSKYTDGKFGIRKLAIRAQSSRDRWDLEPNGGINGMWQRDPNGATHPTFIPIEKALLYRLAHHKGSPEGFSILRRAYRTWYFKKRIETIEAIGIERDLAGVPKGYAPPAWFKAGASASQQSALQAMKDIGVNLRRDETEFILIPSEFDEHNNRLVDFVLMSSGGQRQFDTVKILMGKNRGIAGTMLADFLLIGHGESGSFALHEDKTDLFTVALKTVLDSIAEVLNRHLVPRLFRLNGAPPRTTYPMFKPGSLERVDHQKFIETIQRATAAGMPLFPDPEFEGFVREKLGWPAAAQNTEEV